MARILVTTFALLSGLGVLGGAYWLLFELDTSSTGLAAVARVAGVYNQVEARSKKSVSFERAHVGDPLREGDVVRTGERSRAVVRYLAGLTLNVDPGSMVVITAPTIDDEGLAVQEVQIESGSVSGELAGGRRLVRILDASGQEAARLLSRTSTGEHLRYRFHQGENGTAEVAILSGSAEIDTGGGKRVRLSAGESVALGSGSLEIRKLPPYPKNLRPGVDERIRLDAGTRAVQIAWEAVAEARRYRLQVARSFGFESLEVDAFTDATTFRFEPGATGNWFWRVASIDADGRQGEYGYVRRFYVLSLPPAPGAEAPEAGGEAETNTQAPPEPATQDDLLDAIVAEEEFELKVQVLGKGLSRQARGRGAFRPISGKVKLHAKDVLKAAKATGIRLARGAVIGTEPESQVVLARAGSKGKRRIVLVDLQAGGITTDLAGSNAGLASIVVASRGAKVVVQGEGEHGSRARAEHLTDGLRVITERGSVRVVGEGKAIDLPAGYAVMVPIGGSPGERVALPVPPIPRTPDDGATFVTLDSPPPVVFRWSEVPEATRYHLAISFDPDGTALVYAGEHEKTVFTHKGLRPGKYYWTVRAIGADGVRGRPPPTRSFTILKDTKPPAVTITAPNDGITVTEASIEVRGRTEPTAKVKVNGTSVDLEEGRFSTSVGLRPGLNQIVIEAVDPANNVTFKNLRIRREGP